MAASTRSRWCVTINNWQEVDLAQIRTCENIFRIAQCQYEIGENGIPHIQGWFVLLVPKRLSWLKNNLHPTAHFEMMKGTLAENLKYCTKIDTQDPNFPDRWYYPDEDTVRQHCLSKSTVSLSSLVKAKMIESSSVLLEERYIMHKRNIDEVVHEVRKKQKVDDLVQRYGSYKLKPWQQMLDVLLQKQNERQVFWVYENEGNVGKSWFATYLVVKYNWMKLKAKTSAESIGHMIVDQDPPGLIFDVPRSETEISWSSIEDYKNGFITTTKYHGYSGPVGNKKIIFFSNFPPNLSNLSFDRWKVFVIQDESLFLR